MKFVEPNLFANPEVAARKLAELANAAEAVQDSRIYIERINVPFLTAGGSAHDFRTGLERAITKGWPQRPLRHRLALHVRRPAVFRRGLRG
jgi:hypothetical protein